LPLVLTFESKRLFVCDNVSVLFYPNVVFFILEQKNANYLNVFILHNLNMY